MSKQQSKCNHTKENINSYLTSPLETRIQGFEKLVDYFEYKAPLIDSVHSIGGQMSAEEQSIILKKMLSESSLISNSKFLERIQKNSFDKMEMNGDYLCMKCSRILCRKGKNETELASLLRHIRNGFAHGRLYIKKTKNQTYILIEDIDASKKLSARILVTKAILIRWHKLLQPCNQSFTLE